MTEKFDRICRLESGCLWHGLIREQTTGITAVCRQLDDPDTLLFHDSPKIKAGAVGEFFIKRYNLPGGWVQFRRFFKTARPYTVLKGAAHLEKLGIPTPEVKAAMTVWKGLIRREYLVTALLTDQDHLMNNFARENPPEKTWEVLSEKFLPMLAKLHDSGALHGDLNLRNLYLAGNGKAGLIDLDGMKIGKAPLTLENRAHETARLVSGFLILYRKLEKWQSHTIAALKSYAAATGNVPDESSTLAVTEKFIQRAEKYL